VSRLFTSGFAELRLLGGVEVDVQGLRSWSGTRRTRCRLGDRAAGLVAEDLAAVSSS